MDTHRFDTIDDIAFDRFTRLLGATPRRRTALGLMLGAAMGGLTTLLETTDADARGKGKKKKKKKKQAAACPNDSVDCRGGACAAPGECCPGEKTCGGGCIRAKDCCPYTERECPDGTCVAKDTCCPVSEEPCGTDCCILGTECCHGTCGGGSRDEMCTSEGWCPTSEAMPCYHEHTDSLDGPCCRFAAGEECCFLSDGGSTCCPGNAQCAAGEGCCPEGTSWKGECEACCTPGTTGCSSCTAPTPGRR